MEVSQIRDAGARLEEFRELFLVIKFSEKDERILNKRVKHSNIKKMDGQSIKGIKTKMNPDEYKQYLEKNLSSILALSKENLNNLQQITQNDYNDSILEEVNPHRDLFGYVGVVISPIDQLIDLIYVAYKAKISFKTSCFQCCVSKRQMKMKSDYNEALILNFMRNKLVEELKIEGLTTRGQHHRKERFKPKIRSNQQDDDDENQIKLQEENSSITTT